jgi:hypothetical protein
MKIRFLAIFFFMLFRYQNYMLQGHIQPDLNSTSSYQLKAYLNGNIETRVDRKGYFYFDNLDVGTYTLTIPSLQISYPKYKIVIDKEYGIQVDMYDKKNEFVIPVPHPIIVKGNEAKQYFEIAEGFNLMAMLKSPMGIMLVIFGGMMLCMNMMPKIEELQQAENVNQNK